MRASIKRFAFAGAAAAFVIAMAGHMPRPYAEHPGAIGQLVQFSPLSWRDSVAARAPWVEGPIEEALRTPQFEADRHAFKEDLLRTGRVDPDRADSLATFAVREAYRRRVPPALVFGVLMTENADLKSSSRSNVGAVGLMQIHKRTWVRALGRYFGTDLRDDETNLRYGVYIISHYLYRVASGNSGTDSDTSAADSSVEKGLLRYNGCVRGTNTRNCHSYPDVVRHRIETLALSQCGGQGYARCVEDPLRVTMADADSVPVEELK